MTRSAIQHHSMQAPRGNQKVVFLAVVGALAFAALPFISKEVGTESRDSSHVKRHPSPELCSSLHFTLRPSPALLGAKKGARRGQHAGCFI